MFRCMNYRFRFLNKKNYLLSWQIKIILFAFFCLCSIILSAQVTSEVDTTKIRIGEQINYKIKVETDSSTLVVFPEGQTFIPLESVEALAIDTTKKNAKFLLSRIYKLTLFDSGSYTIPRQKIIIGDTPFFTDSLNVDVNTVKVDTTKQKLYDIKPIIEVNKTRSNWWIWFLGITLIIALITFLLYWFIWRTKPLTEEEEIALLPPYDRAKLALKKLDESQYLIRSEVKAYYSELTFIIRKYLDEKVYDHALESTTDELINRLNLLKDGNQMGLSKDTIKNLESILKRADLVKFAKSAPDTALAEIDRQTIGKEVDHVKESLPEPSEEEKLLDQQYKEAQERKKKRKKVILTIAISVCLIIFTFIGFGIKYGFGYVKDTIIGHESKELLEGDWVKSAYGFPPVWIETPRVLRRKNIELPQGTPEQIKMTTFVYGTLLDVFSITVNTTEYQQAPQQNPSKDGNANEINIDLIKASEGAIKGIESQGAQNITVKREQFTTPNASEGLKTHGTLELIIPNTKISFDVKYTTLHFTSKNVLQQIIITWPQNDDYADEMAQRIIDSIELNATEDQKQ